MSSLSQPVDPRILAREGLRTCATHTPIAFVGLDGFVDEIIHVVDRREDIDHYTRLMTISEYAARLAKAAGKSTNVEWVGQQTKIGGNGPLMSQALGCLANRLIYVGNIGWPDIHPVFKPLTQFGPAYTLAEPGHTFACEFTDGKIMQSQLDMMKKIKWSWLVERLGGEDAVASMLHRCELLALTNWTMVPYANEIFVNFMRLARQSRTGNPKLFFVDLADPEKRTREDLAGILRLLGEFSAQGQHVILGLNHKEAGQVAAAAGIGAALLENEPKALKALAGAIREKTSITEIVIHPRERAAAATAEGQWSFEGPFTPTPKLSTGAGDNFNAGYCHARLRGLEPQLALAVGKATSGYYVRNAIGPTPRDMDDFLTRWAEGRLDP